MCVRSTFPAKRRQPDPGTIEKGELQVTLVCANSLECFQLSFDCFFVCFMYKLCFFCFIKSEQTLMRINRTVCWIFLACVWLPVQKRHPAQSSLWLSVCPPAVISQSAARSKIPPPSILTGLIQELSAAICLSWGWGW